MKELTLTLPLTLSGMIKELNSLIFDVEFIIKDITGAFRYMSEHFNTAAGVSHQIIWSLNYSFIIIVH